MKKLTQLFIPIFLIALTLSLLNYASLNAQTCPKGNPSSVAYQRRDDNRCEGTNPRPISTTFSLISYSIGQPKDYPEMLNIRIPKTSNDSPNVIIQSYVKNYRLDQLKLDTNNSNTYFTFDLKTKPVLEKAKIPLKSLLATATLNRNSREVYYPVILGKPINSYNIVIFSSQQRSFPIVELRRNGQTVSSNLTPKRIPKEGQIKFTWESGNASQGRYELYLKDNNGRERSFYLEHNPNWL
ncbi:MAG: hypothetical protein AB4041_15865 [Microcystaceae cyanobacterium]